MVIFAKEVRTIHRRVPWGNGLYNPHHEDRWVGPTELTWICRLNIEAQIYTCLKQIQHVRTAEKQPKSPAANFVFDTVETFIGCFFMHTEGDGDVDSLAKGCMLRRAVSLAKVVDRVAKEKLNHTTKARV
jgi:hypothetical protein